MSVHWEELAQVIMVKSQVNICTNSPFKYTEV